MSGHVVVRMACECGRNLADLRWQPPGTDRRRSIDPFYLGTHLVTGFADMQVVARPGADVRSARHEDGHTVRFCCRCGRDCQKDILTLLAAWREQGGRREDGAPGRVVLILGRDI